MNVEHYHPHEHDTDIMAHVDYEEAADALGDSSLSDELSTELRYWMAILYTLDYRSACLFDAGLAMARGEMETAYRHLTYGLARRLARRSTPWFIDETFNPHHTP